VSSWQTACPLAAVPEGSAVRVEFGEIPVCLVHTEGEVDGTTVECWLHGSRFDLTTGKPIGLPATEPVPVYDTTIEGETVLVRLES